MAEYSKNYKEINQSSRTVLVKSSEIYGGQILTVTSSVVNLNPDVKPEEITFKLGNVYENPYYLGIKVTSDGNGENGVLNLQFEAGSSGPGPQNFISYGTSQFGSGYAPGQVELNSTNTTNGSVGTGLILYYNEFGQATNLDSSNAYNYKNGDEFEIPGGTSRFIIYDVREQTRYTDHVFVAASPEFVIDNTDFQNTGFYNYNVGENLEIDLTYLDPDNPLIQATVTSIYPDRLYGSTFNHQVLYDRFDRKLYTRIYNNDGTIENVDFNGEVYVPTPLPEQTQFIEFFRISSVELRFVFSNAPISINSVTATKRTEEGSVDFGIETYSIDQTSIRVFTREEIQYDVQHTFTLNFTDVLGVDFISEVIVNIPDPGGSGDNWSYPNYIEWTGSPYFFNESYHLALYKESELLNMGVSVDKIISRIGLPFHLTPGDAGNVTQEVLNDGFVVAATILQTNIEELSNSFIQETLLQDGQFNTSILNVDTQRRSGIAEIVNGERYVFFQIDPYTYSGGDLLVIYWMLGPGALNGGYNGGYIQSVMKGPEEILGFSLATNWVGTLGVVGEKASIAFTTLR